MQRRFLSNFSFLLIVNLLVKPLWLFGVDRSVQNAVGAEDYGIYFALFNFSFLLHIILDFGLNNFTNVSVAKKGSISGSYLTTLMVMKLLLSVIYIVVSFAVALLLNFSAFQIYLLMFMLLNQVLVSLIFFFRSSLAGLHFFRIDAVLSVLDKLLMIGFVAFLLWIYFSPGSFRIDVFVYAQTAAYLITAFFGFILVINKVSTKHFQVQWDLVKPVLRQAVPFALLGVLMSVYNRIDSVMIERMLPAGEGAAETGIYAAGFRILDAVNMFGYMIASLLLPMFARQIHQKENIQELLHTATRLLLFISISIAAITFIYRFEVMELLYHQADDYWAEIFGWLISTFVFISIIYVYGSLLTAGEKLTQLNIIAGAGVILNIGLNFILITNYKALGATYATVITQFLVAAWHVIMVYRIHKLSVKPLHIILPFLFLFLVSAAAYASQFISSNWILNFLIVSLAAPAIAFSLGLLNINAVKNLLTSAKPSSDSSQSKY